MEMRTVTRAIGLGLAADGSADGTGGEKDDPDGGTGVEYVRSSGRRSSRCRRRISRVGSAGRGREAKARDVTPTSFCDSAFLFSSSALMTDAARGYKPSQKVTESSCTATAYHYRLPPAHLLLLHGFHIIVIVY